jgi:hypothetical protein
MLRQQKTGTFVNFWAFLNTLSHTPELSMQHCQAITIKAEVCYVRVCPFIILACIVLVLVLIYKILWKSGAFLNFFFGWVVNIGFDTKIAHHDR